MINTNIHYLQTVIKLVSSFLFLYLYSTLILFQSYIPDLYTRLDTNDSFVNTYFLLWTNFWYLAPFYFALFIFLPINTVYWSLSLLLYSVYTVELSDFITSNLTWKAFELTQFNTLLTNSLNKYHPFIFFASTLLLHYSTLTVGSVNKKQQYVFTKKLKITKTFNTKLFKTNLVALVLGGIWAFQEASWGGFWNWDSSETFGLLFLLTSLYLTHTRLTLARFYELTSIILTYTYSIVIVYCFIQLNFDLVSHNFGAKFFYFFNNSLFYEEVIIFSLTILTVFSYRWWTHVKVLKTLTYRIRYHYVQPSSNYLYTVVIWLLLIIVLLYSCSQLLSYFLFNLLQINVFNFLFSLEYWVALLLILFNFLFAQPSQLSIITYLMLTINTLNTLPLLILNVPWNLNKFKLLHNLLVLTLLINIAGYYMNFIIWFFKQRQFFLILDNLVLSQTHLLLTCDTVFVNISSTLSGTDTVCNWWNLLFQYNSVSTNSFFLLITNTGCFSLYQLTFGWVNSFIFINTPYVNYLYLLTIITLLLYDNFYKQPLPYS